MIALPPQLFYGTTIPACLWFLTKSKKNGKFKDRLGKTLFIDARKMGVLVDRVHRDLTDQDIAQHRRNVSRLARREGRGQVRRRARLLQECQSG